MPFTFDRIAFKMDIEELKARMKEAKLDVNHDNSNERALRSSLGAKVEHEVSLSCASSSNDVTTRTHPRTNTDYFSETPSRRPDEGRHVSSSTKRIRRSRTPKHYDRLISHLSGDASESITASSSASLGSSRGPQDYVRGRLSSTRSIAVISRRAAERESEGVAIAA
jgi:hypothetical protein